MAKIQELVENVMTGYYQKHNQGEELLIMDIQDLVDEGYITKGHNSPYGALEEMYARLREDHDILEAHVRDLEEENQHLIALADKFAESA